MVLLVQIVKQALSNTKEYASFVTFPIAITVKMLENAMNAKLDSAW